MILVKQKTHNILKQCKLRLLLILAIKNTTYTRIHTHTKYAFLKTKKLKCIVREHPYRYVHSQGQSHEDIGVRWGHMVDLSEKLHVPKPKCLREEGAYPQTRFYHKRKKSH